MKPFFRKPVHGQPATRHQVAEMYAGMRRPHPSPPGFVCPRCEAVSHHPTDIAEGYCARCTDWTDPQRGGGIA